MMFRVFLIALACATSLNACAPLVVAGAGAGTVAATDRRSFGSFLDDGAIELRGKALATATEELKQDAHINVTSVNGVVLLTGEAATAELRDRVIGEVRTIPSVRRVVNEIRIMPPSPFTVRTKDSWITTKVKTKLLATKNLPANQVKVVTEAASVYLLGLVTQEEADMATEVARRINGVERVVKLFEHLD